MHRGRAGLGRAVADHGVAHDQVGLVGILRQLDGVVDLLPAVGVRHVDDVPAVGAEAGGHVLAEGDVGAAFDGDLVVVVQGDQLVQLEGAGQGSGLVGDALHQAAVAHDGVGVVVHDVEALAVEMRGQVGLGQRHAHGVADALAQGTGGGFDAGGVAVLGMAGGEGAELAELLQVLNGQAKAKKMQQGVQQHGAVAGGQHEAVAVVPLGGFGVEIHLLAPHGVGHGGGAHGHARMAGLRLLDSLGREHANGVDDEFILLAHWKKHPFSI